MPFSTLQDESTGADGADADDQISGIGGEQMENTGAMKAEIEILKERLARLGEISLRISESPDLNAVRREAVAGACALSGAGVGVIAIRDGSGQMRDFVAHGLGPGEERQLLDLPHLSGLGEYLSEVAEPLRLENLSACFASLGLTGHALMERSFLGMAVRHQDESAGCLYLLDKQDAHEFTREDEGIIALYAPLAMAAIANARKHHAGQQARAGLEALIETSPVGMMTFDAGSGTISSSNREARRMAGDLCAPGRPTGELLKAIGAHQADGSEIAPEADPLARLLSGAEAVRAEEIVIEVPDGGKVTALIDATPVVSESGEVASVAVALRDMTPLAELKRQRTEFVNMVRHELTAPLVSIKGCTTTAVDSSSMLSAVESERLFRIIDLQVDHMRRLIGDLMDSAQIETGSLAVSIEPAELAVMVEKARNLFLDGGRRNPVQIGLPPDLPRVRADRRRIVQALVILLNNASRHSPDTAAIKVEARLRGVHVEVSVVDEGPSIPGERMPHLFRKHARTAGEDRGAGSGLGLAICKGLVEAHGGRIWTESEGTGPGTRFTFTVPVAEDIHADVRPARGRKPPQSGPIDRRKPLVLVVDADPHALGYIREILETAGYQTKVTGDPEKVKELVEAHRPDLLLLDLLLPGTDGIELMESLPERSGRPVIFISIYGREETIARALELGAADYIVKPFSPTELTARIQAALRRHAGPTEPFQAGDLVIDYEERRVSLKGKPLRLTATEFDLLRVLSAHAGRAVTYEQLLGSVWQMRNAGDARVVRVFVRKLRRMLGDDARKPKYIFTEPRVGYRMARPDEAAE